MGSPPLPCNTIYVKKLNGRCQMENLRKRLRKGYKGNKLSQTEMARRCNERFMGVESEQMEAEGKKYEHVL
jgi:hypothetical protein